MIRYDCAHQQSTGKLDVIITTVCLRVQLPLNNNWKIPDD